MELSSFTSLANGKTKHTEPLTQEIPSALYFLSPLHLQWSTLYAQPFPRLHNATKTPAAADQMKLTLQRVHKMARREDGFTGRAAAEIFEIDLLKIRSIWQKIRSRSGLQKVI